MPQTRRTHSIRLQTRRKITRRRSRRATWIDLLSFHGTTTRNNAETSTLHRDVDISSPVFTAAATGNHDHVGNRRHGHPPMSQLGCRDQRMDEEPQNSALPSPSHGRDDGFQSDQSAGALEMDLLGPHRDDDWSEEGNSCCASDEERTNSAAAEHELQDAGMKKGFPLTTASIMALTLVCGSVRFSVQQYEIVRSIVRHAREDTNLPSYSTVQRKLLPHLMMNLFPRSDLKLFSKTRDEIDEMEENMRSDDIGDSVDNDQMVRRRDVHPRTGKARVILPTEWAKIDISTLAYYKNIFPSNTDDHRSHTAEAISIENSIIVRDRSAVTTTTNKLFVEDKFGRVAASDGDEIIVEFETMPSRRTTDEIKRNSYEIINTEDRFLVTGVISLSWCVGSDTSMTPSGKRAFRTTHFATKEVVQHFAKGASASAEAESGVRKRNRNGRGQRFFSVPPRARGTVLPGDICTLLRPRHDEVAHNIFCVVVSRFWRTSAGNSSQFVIWVRVTEQRSTDGTATSRYVAQELETTNVNGIPRLKKPARHLTGDNDQGPTNRGTLPDGRPYVVYRMMLYCDDFRESNSLLKQNKAGGVYILPLGMSTPARSSRTAVHVISLTPPGVKTNQILHHIIPDLVRGTKDGVEGTLPNGEKVMIFTDVVGFVADYLAAAESVDVIGHAGDTPCTHCNIRKLKRNGSSNLGYTTDVHAMNSASLRSGERHFALRESNIPESDAKILGMKPTGDITEHTCPLLAVQQALDRVQDDIPVNDKGVPVVPGLFDAYRSSVIAPDHLLTGVARDVLHVCFQVMCPDMRQKADVAICSALADNGLNRERSVYDAKNTKMYSTSLSTVYCILLVSVPVLSNFIQKGENVRNEALRLLKQLKDLVALTQWKPQVSCDGEAACELIRIDGGRAYISTLQNMAQSYVANVNVFYTRHPEIGGTLDKPNLHRLLELYFHTIPAFGHVALVQELVFETAHQPLKRCVTRGNHRDAEVSAVEHSMGDDWQARLALLQKATTDSDELESSLAYRGLRRLIMGPGQDETGITKNDIEALFARPVVHILKSNGNINAGLAGRPPYWKTTKAKHPQNKFEAGRKYWDVDNIIRRGEEILMLEKGTFSEKKGLLRVNWRAIRTRPAGAARTNSTPGHEVLECGSVVQALTLEGHCNNRIVRPHDTKGSILGIFVTVGFVEGLDDGCWAVVIRCPVEKGAIIKTLREVRDHQVQVLLLTDGVRRVGVYHVCNPISACSFDTRTREVRHKDHILTGGVFNIQTRREGYPPRMA